jgi:hypothetical protein
LLDVLEARSQRAVGYLDRVEIEGLIPERAGERIGAQQRFAVFLGQADHDEFAGTEAEGIRTGDPEMEEPVGVMGHRQYRLDRERAGLGGNGIFLGRRCRGHRHGLVLGFGWGLSV